MSRIEHRSRLETYLDVLKIIAQGVGKPVLIAHTANIPRKMLNRMLENLKGWGLLEQRKARGCSTFLITEKGKRVLNKLYTCPKESDGEGLEKRFNITISTPPNSTEIQSGLEAV